MMRTVTVNLSGAQNIGVPVVYADGKEVKCRRINYRTYSCDFEAEGDSVNLKIYKALDVGGICWFLTQILFFLLSVFGIFDVRAKNKYLAMQYECELDLNTANREFNFISSKPRDGVKAFMPEGDFKPKETANRFYIDESAKKTYKLLLLAKLLIVLAAVAAAIALIVTAIL